jgi:hypothetical protein
MALPAKWQFMDRSVTHKIVYGPQLPFGPYSAMNYLINITKMYVSIAYTYIIGVVQYLFERPFFSSSLHF